MDIAAQHAKARRLVATIEFQLQQLEESGGGGLGVSGIAVGTGGGGGSGGGSGGGGGDETRHALAENVNALSTEVAALERAVGEQYSAGAGASSQKAQLWRKRLSQLQAEATSLRRTVERFLRASYATSRVAQERQALLGAGGAAGGGGGAAVSGVVCTCVCVCMCGCGGGGSGGRRSYCLELVPLQSSTAWGG